MQHNILRESNITKMYMIYTDGAGLKKRYSVKLRFMDSKICYFATPMPAGFEKPKKKTVATIVAYTPDGVYTAGVAIMDTVVSMNDAMFEVNMPTTWNYKQLRASSRKLAELPFTIKFNDGFEISGTTYDISLGGFSFFYTKSFSSIYTGILGNLVIKFPEDSVVDFPGVKLISQSKYVREQKEVKDVYIDGNLYAFKFVGLNSEQVSSLKTFLLSID